MVYGTAFHGDLEMKERAKKDLPVTGKINTRTFAEILTVLAHLFNFRQQDLLDLFKVSHSVLPLVKSDIIL